MTRACRWSQAIEIPDAQGRVRVVCHSLSLSLCGPPGAVLLDGLECKSFTDATWHSCWKKDAAPGEDTKGTDSKNTETDLEVGETDLEAGAAPGQVFYRERPP